MVVIACSVLTFAACTTSSGSESAVDPTTEAPMAEDEFVARFGERCAAVTETLDGLPEPDSFAELSSQATQAQLVATEGLDELRELTPPTDLEDQVTSILASLEAYADGFGELAEAADAEDQERLEELVLVLTAAREQLGIQLQGAGGIDCGPLTDGAEDDPEPGDD